jgi:3-isopropylmalate/(R)-2-methylmalate dehydratase small subunit
MEKFTRLSGTAAPLMRSNIDTDAIIPSRETQSVARTGYGEKLFANWRYTPGTRIEKPEFVLNRPAYRRAAILLGGPNFGCGSSRESAAWALLQFGIRCVIAASFGGIFRNNAVRNGLLPVSLPDDTVAALATEVEASDGAAQITVDLNTCVVLAPDGRSLPFEINGLERVMLLEGLDEIELTLKRKPVIDAFLRRDQNERPWVHLRR